MTVRASVVDIATDQPKNTDRVWVDSNVWFALTYSGVSPQEAKRYAAYSNYIGKLHKAGGDVLVSPVTFAEVARTIEHSEFTKHQARNNGPLDPKLKKATRLDPAYWATVVAEIETSWKQIGKIGRLGAQPMSAGCATSAVAGMKGGNLLDGGDAVMVADALREGVDLFLTNDGDLASVSGITVITALPRTLNLARTARMFVTR